MSETKEKSLTLKSLKKEFDDYKIDNEKNIKLISGVFETLIQRIQALELVNKSLNEKLAIVKNENEEIVTRTNKIIEDFNKNFSYLDKNIGTLNNLTVNLTDKTNGLENNVKTNIKDFKTINDNINLLTDNLNITKKQLDDYIKEKEMEMTDISGKNNKLDTLKNLIDDVQFIFDLKQKNKI